MQDDVQDDVQDDDDDETCEEEEGYEDESYIWGCRIWTSDIAYHIFFSLKM